MFVKKESSDQTVGISGLIGVFPVCTSYGIFSSDIKQIYWLELKWFDDISLAFFFHYYSFLLVMYSLMNCCRSIIKQLLLRMFEQDFYV